MTFVQHTTPCKTCPFRIKNAGFFQLQRAEEIANHLRNDGHFICHNHLKEKVLCAGSLIVADKSGVHPNQMARIQMRLRLLDWDAIETQSRDSKDMYDDLDAFCDAMRSARGATPNA